MAITILVSVGMKLKIRENAVNVGMLDCEECGKCEKCGNVEM